MTKRIIQSRVESRYVVSGDGQVVRNAYKQSQDKNTCRGCAGLQASHEKIIYTFFFSVTNNESCFVCIPTPFLGICLTIAQLFATFALLSRNYHNTGSDGK